MSAENPKEYNGWTNYETWLVALWIDNEPSTHEYSRELATNTLENVTESKWDWESVADAQATYLSELLKEWITGDDSPWPVPTTGLTADLVGAALSEVDWHEIAKHYLDEVAD